MTEHKNSYNESSIRSRDDATALRALPASMLGSNGLAGARHGVLEIAGNSTDESISGHGDKIQLTYSTEDNIVGIRDFGRGVPLNWNPKEERSNWDLVYNDLYASGKYGDNQEELKKITNWKLFDKTKFSYLFSIGLNGVGASSTQFTSRFMVIESTRENISSYICFYKGYPLLSMEKVLEYAETLPNKEEIVKFLEENNQNIKTATDDKGEPIFSEGDDYLYANEVLKSFGINYDILKENYIYVDLKTDKKLSSLGFDKSRVSPVQYSNEDTESGTAVIWTPDEEVFSQTYLNPSWLLSVKDSIQYVTGVTLEFSLIDEEGNIDSTLYEASNLVALNKRNNGGTHQIQLEDLSHGNAFSEGKNKIYVMENKIVLAVNDNRGEYTTKNNCFINTVPTTGGVQYIATEQAILDFFKETITTQKVQKKHVQDTIGFTISTLSNIVSYKGQTKEEIDNDFIYDKIYEVVKRQLHSEHATGNVELVSLVKVLEQEIAYLVEFESQLNDLKEVNKELKKRKHSENFYSCVNYNKKGYVELWIAEGDSAKGSIENSRDKLTQAIYALTGKFRNFLKSPITDLIKEPIFLDLITILGITMEVTDKGIKFDTSKLKVDKVIISTDADVDGYQIRVLVFNFFYRLFPELLKDDFLEISLTPLYRVETVEKGTIFLLSDSDLTKADKELTINHVKRYKGLGQVNADEFEVTTISPKTRTTKPINYVKDDKTDSLINTLFGADIEKGRKGLILATLGQDPKGVDDYIKKTARQIDKNTEKETYDVTEVQIYA